MSVGKIIYNRTTHCLGLRGAPRRARSSDVGPGSSASAAFWNAHTAAQCRRCAWCCRRRGSHCGQGCLRSWHSGSRRIFPACTLRWTSPSVDACPNSDSQSPISLFRPLRHCRCCNPPGPASRPLAGFVPTTLTTNCSPSRECVSLIS